MGLSNSRLESRRSRSRVNRSSFVSSLLCGASSSRASYQMEENNENIIEVQTPRLELSSVSASSSGIGFSGSTTEIVANLGNRFDGGLRAIGTSNTDFYLPESNKEQVSDDFGHDESSRDSNHRLFIDQQSLDTVSVNVSANPNATNGIGGSEQNGASTSSSDGVPSENHLHEDSDVCSFGSDSRFSDQISDLPVTFDPFGSNRIEEVVPSGLGILVSNRERSQADGSVLHVDVLSISPNVLSNSSVEQNSHETRRYGRRTFWDVFSRRGSSRRLLNSPAFLFSMDGSEDVGSRDRWVLGLTGDFLDDASGSEYGYPRSSRIQYSSDRRHHSRAEAWERLRSGFDESGRWYTVCPSGHPDGRCLCNTLNEESSTRASISRIVMLAEALFEVLDEIHRQPTSLSLPMVSSPAPASIVNSFPLKSHSKIDKGKSSEDVAECYICLAEYEEGDKIRVLPCHHEYHMSCVDKWLQEIHGVCPLCRGDVREGITECSVSNSEISSV